MLKERDLEWEIFEGGTCGHRRTMINGKPLDYWPKSARSTFTYDGKTYKGVQLIAFIRRQLGETKPPKKAPKDAKCATCLHWARGFGVGDASLDVWGICDAGAPLDGEDVLYTEIAAKCANYERQAP